MKEIKNIPASIRQKLLNLSKKRNEDFMYTLLKFGIERMLYRLSKSEYSKKFILKGALMFNLWTESIARPTRDVDFLGYGNPSPEYLKTVFKAICSIKCNDGITFDLENIKESIIKERDKYKGTRLSISAEVAGAKFKIKIDIGFGDTIVPYPKISKYPSLLDFPNPLIYVYPVETVISEKLQTLISHGLYTSRLKDVYDLYIMLNRFSFQKDDLKKSIRATFSKRGTIIPNTIPEAFSANFYDSPEKKRQWFDFLKKIKMNKDLSLRDVIKNISLKIKPIFNEINQEKKVQN